MSGLKHASQRCSSAQFVVKADDDVMINVPRLRRILALDVTNSSFIGGRCNNVNVVRSSLFGKYSKWAVSSLEYPYRLNVRISAFLYVVNCIRLLSVFSRVHATLYMSVGQSVRPSEITSFFGQRPR